MTTVHIHVNINIIYMNSSFNNRHYRQNRGTAMGPHDDFSYADLAMTEIDHKILHHDERLNDLVFSGLVEIS